jgi:hypothetical protein
MTKKIVFAAAGYSVVTFVLGFAWHLVLFKDVYETFGVYNRSNPIIPMGFASMVIQGVALAVLYARQERGPSYRPFAGAIAFNLLMGVFFTSGTVLALAAKAHIAHLGAWFGYNAAFSLLQFLLSGIVFGFVFREAR